MSVAEEISRKLGGPAVIGRPVQSQGDLAAAVLSRLPLAVLSGLPKAGLTDQEIGDLIIPKRTRSHRAAKHEPLTVEESDRTVRLLRIQTLAEVTFEDKDKAAIWLRRPLRELSHQRPLDVAQTEAGARLIENILAKIQWGAAA